MCFLPFLGGMNFSILSEKNMTPILSLFCIAEKDKVAAISVTISFFNCRAVPKSRLPDTSMSNITVSSLSSSNTFTNGLWNLAVTFQSMSLISSPYWYSRTSEKAMPRPLNAEWYCPANILLDRPFVLISICLTLFNNSVVSNVYIVRLNIFYEIFNSLLPYTGNQGTSTLSSSLLTISSLVILAASASYVRPILCLSTS